MKKLIFLILFYIPCSAFAQQFLHEAWQSSWHTMIYPVSAADAIRFKHWDSIPLSRFEQVEPLRVVLSNSMFEEDLPIGHYVFISAQQQYARAILYNQTAISVVPVNDRLQLKMDVRNKDGRRVAASKITVNGRSARYHKASGMFVLKSFRAQDPDVVAYTPGDTAFASLSSQDRMNYSISAQRWSNFKRGKFFRGIVWLPRKVSNLFHLKKEAAIGANGFIVFNQPKYKLADTVKAKAYVVDKHGKRYKRPVYASLEFYAMGNWRSIGLGVHHHTSPGAYLFNFTLKDSVPSDISCALVLRTADKKQVIRETFRTGDYVLNEIGTQEFRADKTNYFKTDTLRFFASAKDANGLPLLDAKARLVIIPAGIDSFYQERMYIPDTLYDHTFYLDSKSETKFAVPASLLPAADLGLNATLYFRNSNNETQQKSLEIQYAYSARKIKVTQVADSLLAEYYKDGISTPIAGEMTMNYGEDIPVQFPLKIKIDPLAGDYDFSLEDTGKSCYSDFSIPRNYQVRYAHFQQGDSIVFSLLNPYRIPVYFTVINGNEVVASGRDTASVIYWKTLQLHRRQIYKVRWQFYWAGLENNREERLASLYKLLNIGIEAQDKIFPGQEDSLHIAVTDYKGRPAAAVNLAALSYNAQFAGEATVKDPPYLQRYKLKPGLEYDGFDRDEYDGEVMKKQYFLGLYTGFASRLQLDTMLYYKSLFPVSSMHDALTPITSFVPQVAVHVLDKGIPQEVHLLYLNRELVFYNGVSDRMAYAYPVYPRNLQIVVRLLDKIVTIDSLYMQPFYKHDLSFDLQNLPAHSSVQKAEKFWSWQEMNTLEASMLMLQNTRSSETAYLWQDFSLVAFDQQKAKVIGPFKAGDALQYFKPAHFDIRVKFEPGYAYSFSEKVVRLEKKALFENRKIKNRLPNLHTAFLRLGDTLKTPPTIDYSIKPVFSITSFTRNYYSYTYPKGGGKSGALLFTVPKDSMLLALVLTGNDADSMQPIVFPGGTRRLYLKPGNYILHLITKNALVHTMSNLNIKQDSIFCVKAGNVFLPMTENLHTILREPNGPPLPPIIDNTSKPRLVADSLIRSSTAESLVAGVITDTITGMPIPFVTVVVKGSKTAVLSDVSGIYSLENLIPGNYTLVFSQVGYTPKELSVFISPGIKKIFHVSMRMNEQALEEVVVVGYGMQRKRSLTGATTIINNQELSGTFQGRVAGLSIANGQPGAIDKIFIRGARSMTAGANPLVVIDGIVYTSMQNIPPEMIEELTVLSASEGTAIYGSRAADGVIVIKTKAKSSRTQFRNYAFWVPNFFTDKAGKGAIKIAYPDNVTGWKTFVLGMDKKRRMGKATIFTQAYKPMTAQLNKPEFLLQGDSSYFVTKLLNYTDDTYDVTARFFANKGEKTYQRTLQPQAAETSKELVIAGAADSVTATFGMLSSTGFKDEERRSVPIFKIGVEEAEGQFWILAADTSIQYRTQQHGPIELYAQDNNLDLMLQDLNALRNYPYMCMEQIASKITGLALEKMIREKLRQPFKNQKMLDGYIAKIQKTQQFDGGWPWWENGRSNFYVTTYVTRAMLRYRSNILVEENLRNAFLYLQNNLHKTSQPQLLAALSVLSEAGHEMNYATWLRTLRFDSLTQHAQWQFVKIAQQQGIPHDRELKLLLEKKIETMLGGLHWGEENFRWYANAAATTVLAYEVLEKEPGYANLLPMIQQYFIARKQNGYWRNTVESASIMNAILPGLLQQNPGLVKPAQLLVSGDTSFSVTAFPLSLRLNNPVIKNITIKKQGGSIVYLTAYQRYFNAAPVPVEENFGIATSFSINGYTVQEIKTGDRVKMEMTVMVKKDAEFVMLDVPIPAGCIFVNKTNDDWRAFKEYRKDRLLLFAESLPKGTHQFEVELEPRYSGVYSLNPAKAALMYFPTFFGTNALRKIKLSD